MPDNDEPKKRRGRPTTELERWTVERACRELPINPRTMASRLAAMSFEPDENGYYSTVQIVKAFTGGDYEYERIREVRSKADLNEQELKIKEGQLVDKDVMLKILAPIFTNIARAVKSSNLSEDEQIQILNTMADYMET